MARGLRLLSLLLVCIVAGYFAGQAFWRGPQPGGTATAPPPETAATADVTRLPDFHLKDLASGQQRPISDWRGQGLVLNFWATWCAPCRKEMPLLEQLHQERGDRGPAVVGIAIDREEQVRTFVGETGVSYPILVGQEDAMAAAESFGPAFVGLPLTVVAAPGGDILAIHMGEIHPEDLAAFVRVLDALAAGGMSLAEARQALQPR
jgi:thiol-disulfide isomerase/thioredoxin